MIVLALFETLLFRHTGQEDLTIGYLGRGGPRPASTNVVGYLADPLPLRVAVSPETRFDALLRQTRDAVLEAMAHEAFPFPLVVQALEPRRDPAARRSSRCSSSTRSRACSRISTPARSPSGSRAPA